MVGAAGSGSPPRRFHDRYRLESRIATGGMGTVFAGVDERLGRRVALKLLRDDLARDPAFVERFRREARAVAALAHPNVAGVFDYGEQDGAHFIVMELAEGRDLARVLREEGPLSPDRATRIAEQICDALGHAHAAGVVHRDVKPANVIVGEQDLVKVTDFGIARITGDATLTATGSVLGSAHYISPEQANGAPAGPASDLYATGIVLFEMLTGSLPFTGDSPIGVAMRHVTEDVPAPSTVNPNVGAQLDSVVATATARAPEDRYPDAGAMAAALQATIGGAGDDLRAPVAPPDEAATAPITDPGQTVWPIPGDRWDPQRVGRFVAIAFGVLFAVALALLVLRVTSDDGTARSDTRRGERRAANKAARSTAAETTPAPAPTVPDVAGELFEDAEAALEAGGFEVERNDLPHEEVEEGRVIDTSPPVGSAVTPGQTITLIVSTGAEDEDDEGDGEEGPPGHGGVPPGQQKNDKGKGKDE